MTLLDTKYGGPCTDIGPSSGILEGLKRVGGTSYTLGPKGNT